MFHKVDDNSVGLITWVAHNIYVTAPGTQTPLSLGDTDSTIQKGIGAANSGDTVNVEAGTLSGRTISGDDAEGPVAITHRWSTTSDGRSATQGREDRPVD